MPDGSPIAIGPFIAREIADVLGTTQRAAEMRAAKERWVYTTEAVRGGQRRLYALSDLPHDVRAALLLRHAPRPDPAQRKRVSDADIQSAWTRYEQLPARCRTEAERRQSVLHQVETLVHAGMTQERAVAAVRQHLVASAADVPDRATILAWRKLVRAVRRDSWLPFLAPKWGVAHRAAIEIPDEAWALYKADYLRPEQPAHIRCYRRLQEIAAARGWALPSLRTFMRRIDEIAPQVVVLCREGEEALMRLYPTRPRDRSGLVALEAVNTDGHTFDVFVRFEDGSIGRPVLVGFQDLYSGKLLGWRIGQTESSDLVRLAWGDLVEQWGIPDHLYLDNGRAFASKYLSGGTPTRYRFKVTPEDPLGVWPSMGVALHWTTPYNGKAKPIERAWLDLCGGIDKHPRCAGAYTGNSPAAKPENYGSRAVPIADFRALVTAAIAEHNARPGRRSFVTAGRSFDQTFDESYSRVPIRRATAEQRRLWMLQAEAVTVRSTGHVVLANNGYWHEALAQHIGERVVLRVDPERLQTSAHVYALDGTYICDAPCVLAAGFADMAAATEVARGKAQFKRAVKAQRDAELRISVAQLDQQLVDASTGEVLPALPAAPNVIKPASARWDGVPKAQRDPEREAALAAVVDLERQRLRDAI